MTHRSPIFAIAVLAAIVGLMLTRDRWEPWAPASWQSAQVSAAAADAPPLDVDAYALLQESIRRLKSYRSIVANIRHTTNQYGMNLRGTGRYAQGPVESHQFRLDLKLRVGDQTPFIQHVADGANLWVQRRLPDKGLLGKVDLPAVVAAQAEAASSNGQSPPFTVGGLPQYLNSLSKYFRFVEVREDVLYGLPVFVLKGRWQQFPLECLLPGQLAQIQAGEEPDYHNLPGHAPDHMLLYIGRQDYFPYRIDFRRSSSEPGTDSAIQSLARIEFVEVQVDVPLDAREFAFDPGAEEVIDYTHAYMKSLGLVN